MDDTIWMCRTCLDSFIGEVPNGRRCPGCCGGGQPKNYEWYYAINPITGIPEWVESADLADGRHKCLTTSQIGGIMPREISNFDDLIDSRQVIERIEELESIIEDAEEAAKEAAEEARIEFQNQFESADEYDDEDLEKAMDDAAMLHEPDDEDVAELAALKALAEEAAASPDWTYGETLIRDSYFREYAEELAEDIGAIDPKLSDRWPYRHINWSDAARELKLDYTEVSFGDIDYWIHS